MRLLGIDLDNTLIDYGPAYARLAKSYGLPSTCRDRAEIRHALRPSDTDDGDWQSFQSDLYTEGLSHAVPAVGVLSFLDQARSSGWSIAIVSHKTERTQDRFGGRLMREPAIKWLYDHDVLPKRCASDRLYFEASQHDKLARIADLHCEIFIDDLESVVFHQNRPQDTQMVHYVPGSAWIDGTALGLAGRGDFLAIGEWLSQC